MGLYSMHARWSWESDVVVVGHRQFTPSQSHVSTSTAFVSGFHKCKLDVITNNLQTYLLRGATICCPDP